MPGWVNKKRRAVSLVLLGSALLLATAPAAAKDWERLPDGRVVIEIFDEKLAFTTTPEDLKTIQFYFFGDEAMNIIPHKGVTVTLQEVLDYPDKTRSATAKAKQHPDGVWVYAGPVPVEKGEFVQGKFDPEKLADSSGWTRGVMIKIRPQSRGNAEATPPCKPISKPSKYGFVKETENDSIGGTLFCANAHDRLFKATRPLRVYCQLLFNECSSHFTSQTANLSVDYAFRLKKDCNHDLKFNCPGFTEDKWHELDRQMHEFFSHIIISQPVGVLQ